MARLYENQRLINVFTTATFEPYRQPIQSPQFPYAPFQYYPEPTLMSS